MKFLELLKEYNKYYISHCPLILKEFEKDCDCFIVWYFKQKYFSKSCNFDTTEKLSK